MMGSMGTVVGEKITRLFEYAMAHRLPVVGLYRLRRGADAGGHLVPDADGQDQRRCSSATRDAGLLYLAVLTESDHRRRDRQLRHGGRYPPWPSPDATHRLCRAQGHRADHHGKNCRPASRRAEFLLDHGFVDAIVPRSGQ